MKLTPAEVLRLIEFLKRIAPRGFDEEEEFVRLIAKLAALVDCR